MRTAPPRDVALNESSNSALNDRGRRTNSPLATSKTSRQNDLVPLKSRQDNALQEQCQEGCRGVKDQGTPREPQDGRKTEACAVSGAADAAQRLHKQFAIAIAVF
jgi:hypothetical protein